MSQPTRDDVKGWLIEWLLGNKPSLKKDDISEDSHLERDLGVDSLGALDLEVEIEQEFEIDIEDEERPEIFRFLPPGSEDDQSGTVRAVIDLIIRKISEASNN